MGSRKGIVDEVGGVYPRKGIIYQVQGNRCKKGIEVTEREWEHGYGGAQTRNQEGEGHRPKTGSRVGETWTCNRVTEGGRA